METPPPLSADDPWLALRRTRLPAIALKIWLIFWCIVCAVIFLYTASAALDRFTQSRMGGADSLIAAGISGAAFLLLTLIVGLLTRLIHAAGLVTLNGNPLAYAAALVAAWELAPFSRTAKNLPSASPHDILRRCRPYLRTIGILGLVTMLGLAALSAHQTIYAYTAGYTYPAHHGWEAPATALPLALYGAITFRELIRAGRKLGQGPDQLAAALEHHRRFWKHTALLHFFLFIECLFILAYSSRGISRPHP